MTELTRELITPISNSKSVSDFELGEWCVGITEFSDLSQMQNNLRPAPILRGEDFREWGGKAVADPFAILRGDTWYLFVELFLHHTNKAVIAVASSQCRSQWSPIGIALQQDIHLSYPFVFEDHGSYYMIPETKNAREIALYRAVDFPLRWEKVHRIASGRYMDSTLFFANGRYWILTGWRSYFLRVFHASSLMGPWRSTLVPIAKSYSKSKTRPGGSIINYNGNWVRFVQDNELRYGHQLRAWKIDSMNRIRMKESPLFDHPVCQPGSLGWNQQCMHHASVHKISSESASEDRWIAFVDGSS